MLDGGASVSVIDEKLIKDIGVKGSHADTSIRVISQEKPITFCNQKVTIKVKNATDSFLLENVIVMKNMSLPICNLSSEISDYCEEGNWDPCRSI